MNQRAHIKRSEESQPAIANGEAERAILGAILREDTAWLDVADRLSPADFSEARNREIYQGMQDLAGAGRKITRQVLVSQVAAGDGAVTLPSYLAAVIADEPGGTLRDNVEAVLHASGRRQLILAADEIAQFARSAALSIPIEQVRHEARRLVERCDAGEAENSRQLGEVLSDVVKRADMASRGEITPGIRTGLACFDDLVGPMLPGQLIIVGGETGAGKTALAWQIALMLGAQGVPTRVDSQEMTADELAARAIAVYSQVPSDKIQSGDLTQAEVDRLFEAASRAYDFPIEIDDHPSKTVRMLETRTARSIAKRGTRIGIVDHLQFLVPESSHGKEHEQIRACVDGVKTMAKRLAIPMILISHVNRTTEPTAIRSGADIRRPVLRDLYGSSAIEKAADAVIFVHRPEWFLERATEGPKDKGEMEADRLKWRGKAELVLPKRRGGIGHGVRLCHFDAEMTWFRDLNKEDFEL